MLEKGNTPFGNTAVVTLSSRLADDLATRYSC